MKKHILGALLFVAITSATLSIFNFYKFTERSNLAKVSISNSTFPEEFSPAHKIRQAVISPESGLLSLDVNYNEENEKIRLRFFEQTSTGSKLIAAENIDLTSFAKKRGNITLYKSFDWIKNIKFGANIYVIADEGDSGESLESRDESKVVAVLISNGSNRISF